MNPFRRIICRLFGHGLVKIVDRDQAECLLCGKTGTFDTETRIIIDGK